MKPTIILFLLFTFLALSQEKKPILYRASQLSGTPQATLLNINRISAWYESNGKMEQNPFTGNSGASYPRGTDYAIFTSGLMWGGFVNDLLTQDLRVSGQQFTSGTTPGAILGIRTGITEETSDTTVRIFRIRKDFTGANLELDAAEFFSKPMLLVTSSEIKIVREQYKKDWMEWPAHKGAPFYDADNNGKYEPKFIVKDEIEIPVLYPEADEPGLAGADQVIWYVANDIRAGESPWKTKPIGLEMQITIWGYNGLSNHGLGNTIYKRHRFIFKGDQFTSENSTLKDFYIGHFVDPDLGDSGDDLAGCDTVLNAAFVYNSITQDENYKKFNIPVPAVGYILVQGPIVKGEPNSAAQFNFGWKNGYKNLQSTSYIQYAADFACNGIFPSDPKVREYRTLQGLPSSSVLSDTTVFQNPITGQTTKFLVPGDPVTENGWRDGVNGMEIRCHVNKSPGDRRFLLSSGPFNMSLGDTQEVTFALVGGAGSDRLTSISTMKFFMKQAREYYNYLFPDNPTFVAQPKEQPKEFLLIQNYPNPFNPGTTISYTFGEQIGNHRHVKLKVFDVLGREIAVLVNETKDPGTYQVTWDAKNIPSGIYYCVLKAGNFVQTRKMMLLK